jgi:hypothetical protein
MVHKIGPVTSRKLIAAFGNRRPAFPAGITGERIEHLQIQPLHEEGKYLDLMEKKGISSVPHQDVRHLA